MTNLNKNTYQFSDDWFSHNILRFDKFLSCYKDKPVNFLEIGSYEGRSAVWILENILTHKDSKLTCVEPGFLKKNDILKQNLSHFSNVKLIEKLNKDAWPEYLLEDFDFVYIDGGHSSRNCLFDMILGLTVLKSGGILAVDDYAWKQRDNDGTCPKDAVDLFIKKFSNIEILDIGYQIWFRKK